MRVRFFDPGLSYLMHRRELLDSYDMTRKRGDLILRGDLEDFEINLAAFLGVRYVVGVASGTDALILSLVAANIQPGDEVITSSYTFRATVEAIDRLGAIPVLVDMGEDWHDYITERTKAVIPCHIAGEVLDWKPVGEIIMIEDSCQAISAAPLKGLTACYSFYPAKILGCGGDGGAIATDSDVIALELKKLRNHYKGDWSRYAYNSRLDNVWAAELNIKLKYLPEALKRRKEVAELYDAGLKGVGLDKKREVYQDYIITHQDRDALRLFLSKNDIETMENGYPFPAALIKGAKTVRYESCSLRLPCNENITNEQARYVIEKINEFNNL